MQRTRNETAPEGLKMKSRWQRPKNQKGPGRTLPQDPEKGPVARHKRDITGKRIRSRGRFDSLSARISRRNTIIKKKRLSGRA